MRPNVDVVEDRRLKDTVKSRLFGSRSEKLRIGRFVVLKRIGEGGMGVVYAAYDPELDRKVAIKLLLPEAAADGGDDQAKARLMREAQALARLSHPNVVQIYEVGPYGSEVYVAMEFVEGGTLLEWLRGPEPRTWQQVVATFVQAGRGLAAAHEKKLVHRDFKPGNVLVGEDGQVRVLDFGLARRVRGPRSGGTESDARSSGSNLNLTITQEGSRLGTPAYMAPEQHLGGEIDARTDQFAFCVALYEALYGARPFEGRNVTELALNVTQGKLRKLPRGSSVPEWVRRVVVRGLAVDPSERWPSMSALLDELDRDPTRLRRWLMVGGVFSLAVIGSLAAGYSARQSGVEACAGGRDRVEAVWGPSHKREVKASLQATGSAIAGETFTRVEALLDAYTRQWVDQYTDACTAHQAGEQSAELLDLRMACLDERLAALEAQVGTLADADDTVLERAIGAAAQLPTIGFCADTDALASQLRPPTDPAVADAVKQLREQLTQALTKSHAGRFREALALADEVVGQARSLDYLPIQAEAQLRKAQAELDLQDNAAAADSFARAFWLAVEGEHDHVAADAASGRILALIGLDRKAGAEEWARHAEAVVGRLGRPADAEARMQESLGALYMYEADYERAGEAWARTLELYRQHYGDDYPGIPTVHDRLGKRLARTGKHQEARAEFEAAIEFRDRTLGPKHPLNANSLNGIGATFRAEGDFAAARTSYEQALALSEAAFGPDHLSAARALNNLGVLSRREGDFDAAEGYYTRALAIYEAHEGPEHRDVARTLSNLGVVYEEREEYDKALQVQERALDIRKKTLGAEHPDTAFCYNNLGDVRFHLGDYEQAASLHEHALAIRTKTQEPAHAEIAWTLEHLAQARDAMGQTEVAIDLLSRAARAHEQGQRPVKLAHTQATLAPLLWKDGQRARALEVARVARDALAALGPSQETQRSEVEQWLVDHGGARSP
jgi:tetratricopeptide (TPR) repeat protein